MRYSTSILCVSLALAPSFALAGTATTNASVVVERYPLQLQKYQDLNFGTITPSLDQAGTVRVTPSNAVFVSGGVTMLNNVGVTPAAYIVYGVPNSAFSIILPNEANVTGPAGSMQIRDFVSSLGATTNMDAQGYTLFTVGGTLFVAASQLPGSYAGTFNVTVAYM